MSLQIWLPLDGNTVNQGLAGLQPATTDVGYTVPGKVTDQTYSMGDIYINAEQSAQVLNNTAITIAFWINPQSATANSNIFGWSDQNTGICQFSLFQFNTNASKHGTTLHWSWTQATTAGANYDTNGNYINTNNNSTIADAFTIGQWTHVCVTYQRPAIKIYLNGQLRAERTCYVNYTFNQTTPLLHDSGSRWINDFRLYNHCLTAGEVKQLALGLKIHYPFSDNIANELLMSDSAGYQEQGRLVNKVTNGYIFTDNSAYREKSLSLQQQIFNIPSGSYYHITRAEATIAAWVKFDAKPSSTQIVFADSETQIAFGYYHSSSNKYFVISCAPDATTAITTKTDTSLINTIQANTWYHIAITRSGSDFTLYVNGEKRTLQGGTDYWINDNLTGIIIGGRRRSSSYEPTFGGNISDFRVYMTALSQDDIKYLYNTPISLSKGYTLFSAQFIEEENATSSFLKTGTIKANEIRDCDEDGETAATKLQVFTDAIQSVDFIEW